MKIKLSSSLIAEGRHGSTVLIEEVINHLSDSGLREVALMMTRADMGRSSAGMTRWAIVTPTSDEYHGYLPLDSDDLERCEIVYENSPPWLQARMLPLLKAFREHVSNR